MSNKTPEQLGRAFYEAFDQNNPALFDDILAIDWKPHPSVPGNPATGRTVAMSTMEIHTVKDGLITDT